MAAIPPGSDFFGPTFNLKSLLESSFDDNDKILKLRSIQ